MEVNLLGPFLNSHSPYTSKHESASHNQITIVRQGQEAFFPGTSKRSSALPQMANRHIRTLPYCDILRQALPTGSRLKRTVTVSETAHNRRVLAGRIFYSHKFSPQVIRSALFWSHDIHHDITGVWRQSQSSPVDIKVTKTDKLSQSADT